MEFRSFFWPHPSAPSPDQPCPPLCWEAWHELDGPQISHFPTQQLDLRFKQLRGLKSRKICLSLFPPRGIIPLNFLSRKGRRQKLLSGFFPLRGGVPPLSAKLFWAQWFSVKGGGGYPPILLRKIPLKSRYFRFENSIFCPFHAFLALFGPLYGLFGLF